MTEFLLRVQAFIAAYLPQDKLLHFAVGYLIACLCVGLNLDASTVMLVVVAIAVLKETWDEWRYRGFDVWDLIATALGAVPLLVLDYSRGL